VHTQLFLEARQKDYDILKQYSVRTTVGINNNEFTVIDNLIIQQIVFDNNIGIPKKKPFTDFYYQLLGYANGMDEGCYYDTKDAEWYDKALIQLCEGFNHVENYLKCKYMTEKSGARLNITDSFLFLEKNLKKKKHIVLENTQIKQTIVTNQDEYVDMDFDDEQLL
jgi:hypothetical protein